MCTGSMSGLGGDSSLALLDVDRAQLSNVDVLQVIAEVEAARRALDATMCALVAEVDRRKLARDHGASSTNALVGNLLLLHPGEVATMVRVGQAITPLPDANALGRARRRSAGQCATTGKALASTEITLEHARVIVAALDELTSAVDSATRAAFEHELLAVARERNPRDLAEWAANRGYEIDPGADAKLAAKEARAHERRGLWLEQNFARPGGRMIANLDAAGFAAAQAAIDALSAPDPNHLPAHAEVDQSDQPEQPDTPRDPRTAGQRRADALTHLFASALARGDVPITAGHRPQVVVTVPLDTLRGELAAAGVLDSGATITAETARRLACDAGIIPAVLGTAGEPLDLGRAARLATSAQRRALALHYRGCAFPGCTRPPSWCSAHHIVHWIHGGTTDLSNLVPLCEFHHTVVHHDGWTIVRNRDDGELDFVPPTNVDLFRRPQRQPRLRH